MSCRFGGRCIVLVPRWDGTSSGGNDAIGACDCRDCAADVLER